jgi:hypothetical protein
MQAGDERQLREASLPGLFCYQVDYIAARPALGTVEPEGPDEREHHLGGYCRWSEMWVDFKTEKLANWAGQSVREPAQHTELGTFDIDLYGLRQRETLSRA